MLLLGALVIPRGIAVPSTVHADTAPPPPPISIGTVHGSFFPNPHNSGSFDASPTTGGGLFGGGTPTQPAFTQDFPTIDFDPPASSDVQKHCSNPTGINEYSRPFVDVAPQSDGSCLTETAQGNGQQAGAGGLSAFEAVFTATLTVAQPGQITFNLYSDDGWVLGAGQDSAGDQPTITSVSVSGSGQVVASPLGYTYYQQPVSVQARNSDGSTRSFTTTLYLLRENGTWRYWTTDQPSDHPVGV